METKTMTSAIATKIATSFGLCENELLQQALASFLYDKKRQTGHLKLEILARYAADSLTDLESKIAQGVVGEHPAWEDLIVVENLNDHLEEINGYLATLQNSANNRSEQVFRCSTQRSHLNSSYG